MPSSRAATSTTSSASNDCETCHNTRTFASATFDHSTVTGNCQSCHTTHTQGATWPFAAYKPDCAGCHFNNFRPDPHKKTNSPQTFYTAAELRDCSGACHVYQDATLTTIVQRRTNHHNARQGSWD